MLHSAYSRNSLAIHSPAADGRPWQTAAIEPAPLRRAPVSATVARVPLFASMRALDLFSRLGDEELARLSVWARERCYARHETLLHQRDDEISHLFVLLEGEAALIREDGVGGQSLLYSLRPGDMAGAMALFDRESQPATVRALTPVRILILHRDTLLTALRAHPDLALDFLAEMARRMRQCQRRIAGICKQPAPRRVASAILALVEDRGVRRKDAAGRACLLLRRRPTQVRIAALAGTTRETVSRYLARWERAELLTDLHGDLTIFDESKLRRLAGEEPE